MNVLITGARGQLGHELERMLSSGMCELGEVPEAFEKANLVLADVEELDISDRSAVESFLKQGCFDLVFNLSLIHIYRVRDLVDNALIFPAVYEVPPFLMLWNRNFFLPEWDGAAWFRWAIGFDEDSSFTLVDFKGGFLGKMCIRDRFL